MNMYNADISAGALMLIESKRLAKLMLSKPSLEEWNHAIVVENILQKNTPSTARRQAHLIKKRLDLLNPIILESITEGDLELSSQLVFASCILQSQLLSDFILFEYAGHIRRLESNFNPKVWEAFLTECAYRDESILKWTELTRNKLLQVILRILVQVKYFDSPKKLTLTPPLLHPETTRLLKQHHPEILKVMEQRS